MSATPRTDAAVIASGFQAIPFEFEKFARQLEIELASAHSGADFAFSKWDAACARAEKAEAECTQMRTAIDEAIKKVSK